MGSPPAPMDKSVALANMDICAEMSPDQITAFQQVLRPKKVKGREKIFAAGDSGEEMYLVSMGEIDIRLPTTKHHHKRLAKYGPGTLFGEIAFLQPGPRTGDAISMRPGELWVLDRPDFKRLIEANSSAAIAILMALGKSQGNKLRWSASEIRRLAQW